MTDHPNIELIRRGNEAFQRGDLEAMRDLWHDDAVWHSAGHNWLVGDYQGVDDIIQFFAAVFAFSEGTYRTVVHDILANDHRVVSLQRSEAERSDGRRMSVDAIVVFDVLDGKVKEAWASPWDLYEEDHFYGLTAPPGLAEPPKKALPGPHYWHDERKGSGG